MKKLIVLVSLIAIMAVAAFALAPNNVWSLNSFQVNTVTSDVSVNIGANANGRHKFISIFADSNITGGSRVTVDIGAEAGVTDAWTVLTTIPMSDVTNSILNIDNNGFPFLVTSKNFQVRFRIQAQSGSLLVNGGTE